MAGTPGHIDSDVSGEPLDIASLIGRLDRLAGPGAGAIAHFIGRVRDTDASLTAMTLEHFPGMTQKALATIAEQAIDRFQLSAALIRHRYGRMTPGEPIVFVGAASPHRQASLDAVAFMMDYLKTDAPFWKLEQRGDTRQWVDARDSDNSARKRWAEKKTGDT